MSKATLTEIQHYQMACPKCGAMRECIVDAGHVVPLQPTPQERHEARSSDRGRATGMTEFVLTDSEASFTPDAFKGATLRLYRAEQDHKEYLTLPIKENNETTITVDQMFEAPLGTTFPGFFDPNNPPYYAIFDYAPKIEDATRRRLWSKNKYICSCGERYTVDKP